MSRRELVVLGTASQVPTRTRNHNGYVLFWDGEAILFDPGEGTQRQMLHAGISATDLTRIAITHLHGDHSLGLAGVIQRISLDRVPRPIPIYYPASGQRWIENLRDATLFYDQADLTLCPITSPGLLATQGAPFTLTAAPLDHGVEVFGYRLDEPDGRTFDTDLLADAGIFGPDIGLLQRTGTHTLEDGSQILIDDVSVPRRGQSMAFIMDTRECAGAAQLAQGVDLLVIESTFLNRDRELAEAHGHLTAIQAATIAAEAEARTLVLTHFSQRYSDPDEFYQEARMVFDGELFIANDLDRIPLHR